MTRWDVAMVFDTVQGLVGLFVLHSGLLHHSVFLMSCGVLILVFTLGSLAVTARAWRSARKNSS